MQTDAQKFFACQFACVECRNTTKKSTLFVAQQLKTQSLIVFLWRNMALRTVCNMSIATGLCKCAPQPDLLNTIYICTTTTTTSSGQNVTQHITLTKVLWVVPVHATGVRLRWNAHVLKA